MSDTLNSRTDFGARPDRSGRLELISRKAQGKRRPVALLFVHGIHVGGWVWAEHFLDYFAEAGFESHALSLRGHGESWGADRIDSWTLSDYAEDIRLTLDRIEGPVVLVGHSLGGAVVQKFIQSGGDAAGMALLASVPPWGFAASAMRMAFASPHLFSAVLRMSSDGKPSGDRELLRELLFEANMPDHDLDRFLARAGRESPRIGAQVQGWQPLAPDPWRSPLSFVLGGSEDAMVPRAEVAKTGLYYWVRPQIVPDAAHMLMLGSRWTDTAGRLKDWLQSRFEILP